MYLHLFLTQVRQLLGPNTIIHAAEVAVASTDILEYTVKIQPSIPTNDPTYLNIVDVPGLELIDNLEHDAEILANLKSYLHEKGLPAFFLVVYRIDDKEIAQPDSQFKQLLRRVEYFQQALFQTTTDNTVFLLTRLLNEPANIQASPTERINEFRTIIQQSTSLGAPIEIIVGDNKPDENTTQKENGFFKLPNGELYPKNIWDKLLQVADRSLATQQDKDAIKNAVNSMIANRESTGLHTQEVVAHATDEDIFESDLEAFEYLLRQKSIKVPNNEVQKILHQSYEHQDASTQIASSAQLLALQICMRDLKVESIEKLPQTLPGMVKLFQEDVHGVMTYKYSLFYLKQALHLDVPEYPNQDLIVGHGYDIINDRVLRKTPFSRNPSKRPSSSLGYQFPDYMECEKMPAVEEVILANSSETADEYHEQRLNYLTLPDREDIVVSQLKGNSKEFLNFNSATSHELTAVKEIRILECKMTVENDSIAIIDDTFVSAVNNIAPLKTSDSESVAEWKLLLHNYGTHVITKGYGGGCFEGTLALPQGEKTKAETSEILTKIANFGDLTTLTQGDAKALIYGFYEDDDLDVRATHINLLTESDRNEILNLWKHNLNLHFEMLTNELELVPLSQVVGIVDDKKGTDAVTATKLLLQGKLDAPAPPAIPESDTGARRAIAMDKSTKQANALKAANQENILGKINQFNEFVKAAGND